jgi:hypothetical protein
MAPASVVLYGSSRPAWRIGVLAGSGKAFPDFRGSLYMAK